MDHSTWNQFVLDNGPRSGQFLQSWEWGEFQKAAGVRVRREEFVEKGKLVGVAQWLDRRLPLFGEYGFCPKGPIGAWRPRVGSRVFLRVEPAVSDLSKYALRKSINLDPARTIITDLSRSAEDLLATMHRKTRYNIRLAQKRGVDVNVTGATFKSIWELFKQTSSRARFRLHPKRYYEMMLSTLKGNCRAFLATASRKENLLAANIMIDFGDTRTYLHGASSDHYRNFMGPHLLHWNLMLDAKARGFKFYDWWGVAPPMDFTSQNKELNGPAHGGNHPWAGLSRFKRGFGGEEVVAPGTYDLVFKPWRYRLYRFARQIRRKN